MSSKSEKEKQKQIQDKCLAILAQLLRDEDNKYCVDCDAKGPRWASWNLGIFLCIRCAGIHRNLGVHISKVKSVNLDSWTPEQVAYLQEMGNSRARAVYEANLPDNFRRPQTDSSLEAFIRSKYETKKYIAKEWVPPQISKIVFDLDDDKKKPKEKKSSLVEVRQPASAKKADPELADAHKSTSRPKSSSGTADLLELNNEVSTSSNKPVVDDLFGGFISAETSQVLGSISSPSPNGANAEISSDLKNEDLDGSNLFAQPSDSLKKQPLSNESILSLYNQGGSNGGGGAMQQMMGMSNLGNNMMFMGQGAYGAQMMIPPYAANGVPPSTGQMVAPSNAAPQLNPGTMGTNPFLGSGLCSSSFGNWYPPTNYSHQQLQMQMASLSVGGGSQMGFQQGANMMSNQGATGALPNNIMMANLNVNWSTGQPAGQTLSVNLWK